MSKNKSDASAERRRDQQRLNGRADVFEVKLNRDRLMAESTRKAGLTQRAGYGAFGSSANQAGAGNRFNTHPALANLPTGADEDDRLPNNLSADQQTDAANKADDYTQEHPKAVPTPAPRPGQQLQQKFTPRPTAAASLRPPG